MHTQERLIKYLIKEKGSQKIPEVINISGEDAYWYLYVCVCIYIHTYIHTCMHACMHI
jgi:hypothetical protein